MKGYGKSTVTIKKGADGGYGIEFWKAGEPTVESETGRYEVVSNTPLRPHTAYVFRFEYKNELPGFPQLFVNRVPEGVTEVCTTEFEAVDHDWRTYEVEFTTGDVVETPTRMEWVLRRMDHFSSAVKGSTEYRNIVLIPKDLLP